MREARSAGMNAAINDTAISKRAAYYGNRVSWFNECCTA